tara:strand:+ start:249 stop:629 length:381 start_codon:yes stop_codon:yes gene_type:complete
LHGVSLTDSHDVPVRAACRTFEPVIRSTAKAVRSIISGRAEGRDLPDRRFWRIETPSFLNGGRSAMQALIQMIAGFIALLAAAALSQFGVNMHAPRQADREIHRVTDCENTPTTVITPAAGTDRDC